MAELFDVYSDNMRVSTTPWGSSLIFGLNAIPPVDSDESLTNLGIVRMSNEQLKVAVFLLWHNMLQHEQNVGARCDVPTKVLEGGGVDIQQWDRFWRGGNGAS